MTQKMTKLEKAKQIIEQNYENGDCGLYATRNIVGDALTTIFDDGELRIDICYGWMYFEVFGLSEKEFIELHRFYEDLAL